jgi:hypothetical protein
MCSYNLNLELNGSLDPTVEGGPELLLNNAFFTGTNGTREHMAYINIRCANVTGGNADSASIMLNGHRKYLVDNITLSNWANTATTIYTKRNCEHGTIRRYYAIDNVSTRGLISLRANNLSLGPQMANTEVLRVVGVQSPAVSSSIGLSYLGSATKFVGPDGPFYVSFCTFVGYERNGLEWAESCADTLVARNIATDADRYTWAQYLSNPDLFYSGVDPSVSQSTSGLDDLDNCAGAFPVPTLTQNWDQHSLGPDTGCLTSDFNSDGTFTAAGLARTGYDRGTIGHEIA